VTTRRVGRPRSRQADEAILRAAVDQWAERSFSGMTMEGVAARAGVARSTVYRRWSSLEELCLEALNQLREPFPTPPGDDLRDDLLVLLRALRHQLTDSRLSRLIPHLAVEASRRPDLSLRFWNDFIARGSSVLADVLRRGIDDGSLRPDLDVELAVDLLSGPVFKRSLWQLPTSDADLRTTIEVVLTGLAAGPG
jgi:AcrR family transcriptional regulator